MQPHNYTSAQTFLYTRQQDNIQRSLRELGLPDLLVRLKHENVVRRARLSEICVDPVFARGRYPVFHLGEQIGYLVHGSFEFTQAHSLYESLAYRLATSGGRNSRVKLSHSQVTSWAEQLSDDYRNGLQLAFEVLLATIFTMESGRAHTPLVDLSSITSLENQAARLMGPMTVQAPDTALALSR